MKIVAVIVTFNRDLLLERAIKQVKRQTFSCSEILVIDNANLSSTKNLAIENSCFYIPMTINLGAAAGYKVGIKKAIEFGAEFIWTLDDDGYPAEDCLKELINFTEHKKYTVIGPLSIAVNDNRKTANPFWINGRKVDDVRIIERSMSAKNKVQFFNGILFDSIVFSKIGYPMEELFIRGDEIEFYYRCKKARLKMRLVPTAKYFHPSSSAEFVGSRLNILSANVPNDENKRFYQFRNRGYVIRKYNLLHLFILDIVRYPFTFLILRKFDFHGLVEWFKAWFLGLRGNLSRIAS